MTPTPAPWSAHETDIVAAAVAGEISLDTMFDALPGRSVKAIARKYAGHGDPDSDTRIERKAIIGSKGLERAIRRMLG